MSSKTKADLEAEIADLKAENAELRTLVSDLKLDNRGLRSVNEVLLENADWDQRKLKIRADAHGAAISESVRLANEKPNIIKGARSENARNAANARWEEEYPEWKEKALKDEYKRVQKDLGPNAKDQTIYKLMAKQILGDEKYYRRIKNQLLK
jgi:hypothetical protein